MMMNWSWNLAFVTSRHVPRCRSLANLLNSAIGSRPAIGDGNQHTGRFWFIKSITVDPERAARVLAGYDAKQFRTIDASDPHYKPELAGPIEFGRIKFDTRETNDDPYLLEITADNYEPVYLLEAHLGGCSRRENVLLTRMR